MNALLLALLAVAPVRAQTVGQTAKDKNADLFLNFKDVGLGETSTREGEKKQFRATIDLEKERLTHKMLLNIFEDAHELFDSGNYDGARQLTSTILQIDPNFEQAAFLQKAAGQLEGTHSPRLSQKRMAEEKFEDGLTLYRDGRVVEAAARWREVEILAPYNLKVRYWLRRANQDLAEEHIRRGQELYTQRRLREALDQFYDAFARDPKYPRLESVIAQVEAEYQSEEAGIRLQEALGLYGKGDLEGTAGLLKKVLELAPGNGQAARLYAQVRAEIADKSVAEAKQKYADKDYAGASEAWRRAASWGYDATAAQSQVARIQEAQKREETRKKDEERLARKKAREEKEAKKKELEAKKEEKKSGGGGMIPGIQMGTMKSEGIGSAADEKKTDSGAPPTSPAPAASAPAAPAAPVVTEENKKNSDVEYQKAMQFYMQGDNEKAMASVTLALQLDPGNADADSLKQRIEQRRSQ